jgi:hypothetical protein
MSQGPRPKSILALTVVLLVSTPLTLSQTQNQSPSGAPTTAPGAVPSTNVPGTSTTNPTTTAKPTPPTTGSTKPGSTKPGSTKPGSTKPGTTQSGSNNPGRGTNPGGKPPYGTTETGVGNSGINKGRPTISTTGTPHTGSGGGGHGGAIAAGTIGAAAAGIGIFEALHHAHGSKTGQEVQRLGLSLDYPDDWQLNPRLNLQEDPINFNNFNSSYLRGGIIPKGGADIDIAFFPSVDGPVPQLITSELPDTNEKTIDKHAYHIGGKKGTRVFYTDVYARGFTYKNIAVYVPREYGLYKFFLTYHEGDPHEKAFNEDFEHILKSVRFDR